MEKIDGYNWFGIIVATAIMATIAWFVVSIFMSGNSVEIHRIENSLYAEEIWVPGGLRYESRSILITETNAVITVRYGKNKGGQK